MKKKFLAFLLAGIFSLSCSISVAAANEEEHIDNSTQNVSAEGELTISQIKEELLRLGYKPVSDEYVNNMLCHSGAAYSTRSASLPYSSGVAYGDAMTYALTPVFDVTGQLNNKKQVLLYWTKNSGKKKISATSYIYIPNLGWQESTTKNTTVSPATVIGPSTINSSITQFYVQFNRDDSLYATDFDYSLSIADYPLT